MMTTTKRKTTKKTAAGRTAKKPSTKRPTKKTSPPRGAKATKKTPTKKTAAKPTTRKPGALDSAGRVLAETKQPMSSRELIEVMATKGYWKSPAGKTPHATLYAAIIREIATKGKDARFTKVQRGRFALASKTAK